MGNLHGLTPPPARTGGPTRELEDLFTFEEKRKIAELLGEEYEAQEYEVPQLMWLANQPPENLPVPEVFYSVLDRMGFRAFIPVDNWRSVMGG